MPGEIGRIAIAMQPIDDLHLLIENENVLSSFVLWYLNIDVPSYYEFAFIFELKNLVIHSMQ